MRKRVTTCDICGRDITYKDRYKFKHMVNNYPTGITVDIKDMCQDCFESFEKYARQYALNKYKGENKK